MTISIVYWVVFIIAVLVGGYGWSRTPVEGRWSGAWPLLLFVLLGLLGYSVYGGLKG